MSAEALREVTLEDVAEFHQQLMRLDAAGLSLQLDDRVSIQRDLQGRLNEIMAELATQSSRTKSLGAVISNSSSLPTRYRLALEAWVRGDRSVDALAMLRQPVQMEHEGSADLRLALVLPLVIFTVIYCASFYLLWVTLPRMEDIYLQFNSMTPSVYVRILRAVREAMPIWVPGLPLLLLILGLLIATGRLNLPRWLPGRARAFDYLNAALVARTMAMQIDSGNKNFLPEPTVNESSTQPSIRRAMQSPMLRWALAPASTPESSEQATSDAEQQSRRLRMAARLYETMQAVYLQRFRVVLLLVTCVVVGGGLTLMYALALFAPLIQLLKDIT